MTGGLLQLIASGNQDLILTYKPEFTFFKKVHHRHTNFSKFYKEINLKKISEFSKANKINVPKHGDLLDNIYLKVNLPKLNCKYSLSKYEQYRKTLNDKSIELINNKDYTTIKFNLDNLSDFLKNNNSYNLFLTDENYSNSIDIDTDNFFRYITTDNWPTFDNWDNYQTTNSNIPHKRKFRLHLPKTPEYAQDGHYSLYENEFGNSKFQSYGTSLDEVPPQFWTIGIVGRNNVKNKHWNSDTLPLEAVILDPIPAAVGGLNNEVLNPITINEASNLWDTNFVSPSQNSFEINSFRGLYYKPGFYYRYYLNNVNNLIQSLTLDQFGGHVQKDGDWHIHLDTIFRTGYDDCVIGYALDGTPIMGNGSIVYNVNGDQLGSAESSWIRRTDYSEFNSLNGNGYFHYDYIHSDTEGNLDEFNGVYTYLNNILTYCYFITNFVLN